jgi:hypothetical protein
MSKLLFFLVSSHIERQQRYDEALTRAATFTVSRTMSTIVMSDTMPWKIIIVKAPSSCLHAIVYPGREQQASSRKTIVRRIVIM